VDAVIAAEGVEIDADATGTQASRKIARSYLAMTPQPMRGPALPAGCDLKSSTPP
jgi:hypothetical protein